MLGTLLLSAILSVVFKRVDKFFLKKRLVVKFD